MDVAIIILAVVCAIVPLFYMAIVPEKLNIEGDYHVLRKPFEQPPGAVRYRTIEPTGSHTTRTLEHFIVSTETTGLPAFSIRFLVLAKLSKAKLEGYSDDLFKTVYRSHTSSRNLPPTWGRAEQTELLLAMSSMPVNHARLESRKGRLVLHWYREARDPSQFNPAPEQLLENTKTMLEGLAIRLADLGAGREG